MVFRMQVHIMSLINTIYLQMVLLHIIQMQIVILWIHYTCTDHQCSFYEYKLYIHLSCYLIHKHFQSVKIMLVEIIHPFFFLNSSSSTYTTVQDNSNLTHAYLCARLRHLDKSDTETKELEKARNELESFILDYKGKLTQESYIVCSTKEERINLHAMLHSTALWFEKHKNDQNKTVITIYISMRNICFLDSKQIELEQHNSCFQPA